MTNLITNPQGLSPYELVMDKVLEYAKVDATQIETLMNMIAYHETGPEQRMLPEAQQIKGPGRGLFQYELDASSEYPTASGAGKTAMTRLLTTLGEENLPKWAFKYFDRNPWTQTLEQEGDVDFSELTEEQQKLLFLADKLQDPAVKLGEIGTVSDSTWWAKYHHKGGGSTEKFDSSKRSYLNNSIK